MTVNQFRRMALDLPDVEERAHMGHPDFRVRGRILATLGYPDKGHGALMLTPEQQTVYVSAEPEVFKPATGAWGRAGSTVVRLSEAHAETVGEAMTSAWRKAVSSARKKAGAEGGVPSVPREMRRIPGTRGKTLPAGSRTRVRHKP